MSNQVENTTTMLATHLSRLWKGQAWEGTIFPQAGDTEQAVAILANPQAHIDALVEAGVLARGCEPKVYGGGAPAPDNIGYGETVITYRVVAPHVHEWRAIAVGWNADQDPRNAGDKTVMVECSCRQREWVPNRLPIEAPDE